MPNTGQIHNIEKLLDWLKSCPFKLTISSMQGGFIHVKFFIDYEAKEE